MELGALIARLQNETDAAETLQALGDLVVFSEVAAAAERYGEQPGEYVAASTGQFAAAAGDEAWLGLIAAMERSEDPGRAAMVHIVRWAMDRDKLASEPEGVSCSERHGSAGSEQEHWAYAAHSNASR